MPLYVKILAGVAIAILIMRGGASALLVGAKFLAPLAVGYWFMKSVKNMLVSGGPEKKGVGGSAPPVDDQTIEICPKCGTEKKRGCC